MMFPTEDEVLSRPVTSPREETCPTAAPSEDGWWECFPSDAFHHPLCIGRAPLFRGRLWEGKAAAVLTVSDGLFPLVGRGHEVKALTRVKIHGGSAPEKTAQFCSAV